MIPTFPKFKKIELSDFLDIQKMIEPYKPYSDFLFSSMYSWDVNGTFEIAQLQNNLIVKFKDYEDDTHFYSLIGSNKIDKVLIKLFTQRKDVGLTTQLKLIPEDTRQLILDKSHLFDIYEDADNFDYVISISEWAKLEGSKYFNKRRTIKKLLNKHILEFKVLDLQEDSVKQEIITLFNEWAERGERSQLQETKNELLAIKRLLHTSAVKLPSIVGFGVLINERLEGFAICDMLEKNYVYGLFEKANNTYQGIYEFLFHSMAGYFSEKGFQHFNIAQDMGIPGLREKKISYKPEIMLKKYTVTKKNNQPLDFTQV